NDNELSARRVRRIKLDSRAEGCVVDDDNHTLYVAEESEGIWRMDARPDRGNKRKLVDSISYFGDLYRDIEGVTLYKKTGGEGYLIASSQRRNRFVVYDRRTNHRLGAFTISESANTDAVTYTDGIFATSTYLGPKFPDGLFIAQDNDNTDKGQEKTGQNFKIVDWRDLQPVLDGFEK
ncbi:MAG: phytase, partial [Gammaproteobacteria bacterium]|nr:phytase [Gammaproteobacteria bacterium]